VRQTTQKGLEMNDTANRTGEICPACGEGHLSSSVHYSPAEYNGHTKNIALHSSVCDFCGSVLAGSNEAKLNKRAMAAFRKEVDSLLSGLQIRKFRVDYCLSQEICAELFGGGVVAFTRYENDDVMQSGAMDRLLRLCIADPKNIILLAGEVGVSLPAKSIKKINALVNKKFTEMISEAFADMESSQPEWQTANTSANDNIFEMFAANPSSCSDKPDQWAIKLAIAA
jgi:HTH-type transcriptional regulator/antitoxin MqsA